MAKSNKPGSRKRRVQPNGRSYTSNKHVRFHQWMMMSPAFNELDAFEVRLLLELYSLFNGSNNGELFLSCREAARRCHMGKTKASDSFRRLIQLGFIRRRADEPERYNLKEANHWILTEFDFGNIAATKDFMNWKKS